MNEENTPKRITINAKEKLWEMILKGETTFQASNLYPNFEEIDALALFRNDVAALEEIRDKGEIEIIDKLVNKRTGNRDISLVKIKKL